jgi:hypothetical protein
VLGERDADINKCDIDGVSPICIAAQQGHVECIRVLHALGANVNGRNNVYGLPIIAAADDDESDRSGCVQILVELGANDQEFLDFYYDKEDDKEEDDEDDDEDGLMISLES